MTNDEKLSLLFYKVQTLEQKLDKAITELNQNRYRGCMPDWRIEEYAKKGMIFPFEKDQVTELHLKEEGLPVQHIGCLSYGLTSYGYDLRLAPEDFFIFKRIPGEVVDPKGDIRRFLEPTELHKDETGHFFILPAHSYALGYILERLDIPAHVLVFLPTKSTPARVAIASNNTTGEPKWKGHLTIEISNDSGADVKVYANEGIITAVFIENEPCKKTYADRPGGGKYQGQAARVTLPKVKKV